MLARRWPSCAMHRCPPRDARKSRKPPLRSGGRSTVQPRTITKKVRFEVLKRDGFKCRYCGTPATDTVLHVDHVVPVALGGYGTIENCAASCVDCNFGKSDRPLLDDPAIPGPPPDTSRRPRVWTAPRRTKKIAPLSVSESEYRTIWDAAQARRESVSEFLRKSAIARAKGDCTCASTKGAVA